MPALSVYPTQTPTAPPVYEEPVPVETAPPPPPQEQYVEPTPAPVQTQEAAPPPQSTPPPEGFRVLGKGSAGEPIPTQQAPAPVAQQVIPPSDDPSAASAIQEVFNAAPGAVTAAPAWVKDAAAATPGAIQEFTGTGDKRRTRTYQPGDPSVTGVGQELYQAGERAADQGLQDALAGGPGNILNIAGAAKDVGLAKVASNMGEISPEGAGNRRALMDAAAYRLEHGEWPEWTEKEQVTGPGGVPLTPSFRTNYENDASMREIIESGDPNFLRAYKEGYTDTDGTVYDAGPDAMWAYLQSGRAGGQKALADLTTAPISTLADVAATVLTAGGTKLATEGAEQAARGIATAGAKQAVGKGLIGAGRGIDAAATLGLSEAVPAGFKVLGKGYNALPWLGKQTTDSRLAEEATALGEAGGEVLANRRMAEGQQGVPSVVQPSFVTNPGADKSVFRVAIPADGANPPIDITYKVGKDGTARGVYDVALPGPTDRYRPITVADAEQIYEVWGRLPNADRQKVRQAMFPTLSRLETAPGEPFIDQAADKVFDRAGNLIADTGRVGEGARREMEDLRRTIMADGRPEQIVTDFTTSWQKTLTDGMLHPLTRRSLAEHRLQMMKDTLNALPAEYRTPEIMRHVRQMEDMLPKDAPATVGTGYGWRGPITGKGGGLAPVRPREATWLREIAAAPLKDFRKRIDGGRVGTSKGPHLVFDRQVPATAPEAYRNGYATYLDIMDFRLKNPPSAREELRGLKEDINGLRTAAPTPAAASREAAIKDALERSGLIPGATRMNADTLVIAIENHLRVTKPTFPPLPGARVAPPAGVYPAGSQDELWGMKLDDKLRDALDVQIDISGTSRNAGQRLFDHWTETAKAFELAKRQVAGIPLSKADEALLNKQVKKIAAKFPERKGLTGTQLAAMTPEEMDRIAANLLKADMEISQGVRSAAGRMLTPAERRGLMGKSLEVYDRFIAMWRSTVLYNVARGVGYPMMQAAGNLGSIMIAARKAAPYYLNPRQWGRSLAYLRDPEVSKLPRAVEIREKVGLGRSSNLGRVSRDQLGARTAFNQEDSHGITKAIGAVLAPQAIKDFADSWDQSLRHALYQSVFEPAYRRLKRDLTPMAGNRFNDYAARNGVPITLSRNQIDTAIKQLEKDTGGYFSQPQLRQALYEAAGGKSAANQKVLWDAADRTARDYKEELAKIDKVAQAEVDRVAFAGGDTNLESLLSRLGMFTWWVARASRLYTEEAAKSPIQMALWGRAIEDANRREQSGTSPRYKFYQEFMTTPAGYTGTINPFGLLGNWLLGTTDDPTDERSVMTGLGSFLSGGWVGDNLVMSPLLQSAAFAIGALGQDARTPDIFGTNRIEREIVDMLNKANHDWITFQKTKGGNPDRIAYPGFSQGVINRVAQALSGHIAGTQQVAGFDPNASPEAALNSYVTAGVLRDNPELDPYDPQDAETIRHGVDLAMADHDSALYQEALGLWTDSLYQGPLTDKNTAALDVLGAVTRRWVSPIPMSIQPTERAERQLRRGRDELRDAGSQTLTSDPESSEVDKRMGMAGVQSPEGRDLALVRDAALGDPQTQAIKGVFDNLLYGDATDMLTAFNEAGFNELTVDGYTFTAEQIATLPDEDRRAIANRFLDSGTGNRQVMDAYYEQYNAQLRSDKAFADAEGLAKYAQQYPGGIDRFVDDTAQVNPNYKAFIEGQVMIGGKPVQLPELRVTDHAMWEKQVTMFDQAASVMAGVKDGRYGLDIDPRYAGVVAGLDEPVGAWLLRENEEKASGKDSEFVAKMRADYDTITNLGQALDTLDQQWGQTVGTNRAIMAQRLINGEKYPLDLDMKAAVESLGVTDTTLDNPYAAGEYLAWSVAQPAGVDYSIDAYQRQYWAQKNAEAIPQIYERIATGQVPALREDGTAAPVDFQSGLTLSGGAVGVGPRPGLSTIGQPTILADQPGSQQGVRVPAGLPIQTQKRMAGSDGSIWAYVIAADGIGGWINESLLQPAA